MWCGGDEAGGEQEEKIIIIQQQNVLVEESSQSFGMDVTHRNIVLSDNMSLKNDIDKAKMALHKKKVKARMVICLTPSRRF